MASNYIYTIAGNEVEITEYTGNLNHLIIPDSIDGMPVTKMGSYAFTYFNGGVRYSEMREIVLPETIKTIWYSAFEACVNLRKINIPDSVTKIEGRAFYETIALTEITIPGGVQEIGLYAFYDSGLASVIIRDGVKSIGKYAFGSCGSLTSVTIPESVEVIGEGAFIWSDNVTIYTYPGSYAAEYAILNDIPVSYLTPTPTPLPAFIVSSDPNVVVDQETKQISYPHYKIGSVEYHHLDTIKGILSAASGYTYEIKESDGVTTAPGMYTEPTHKAVVSNGGEPVATYTFLSMIQYGDINGDGAITASDLGLLKKYLAKKTAYPFSKPYGILAADISKTLTGTNTVTAIDLGLLKRYLMNKTGYPISEPAVFVYDPAAVS